MVAVMKSEMTSCDLTEFYRQMDLLGIEIWIDGGWGVDALLENRLAHTSIWTLCSTRRTVDQWSIF